MGLTQDMTVTTQSFFDSATRQLVSSLSLPASATSEHSFKAPHIEGLEFRTETNDFDLSEQDYTFRISPTSKKIRKAQKDLYELYVNNPENPLLSTLNSEIETSYQSWIELYVTHERQALSEDLLDLMEEKKAVLEKMIILPDFKLKDFVDLQKEVAELDIDKVLLEQKQKAIATSYDLQYSSFSFIDLINVDEIESTIKSIDPNSLSQDDKEEIALYEKDLLQKELNLELAENQKIFEWGQLAYRGINGNPLKEVVSIGAAFRWPHDGNNRLKIEELKIKLNQIDGDRFIEDEKLSIATESAKAETLAKIETYRRIVNLRETQKIATQKIVSLLLKDQNVDPIDLLNIKEDELKEQIASLELLEGIYNSYINTLSVSRLMYKMPLNNYLR